MKAAVRRVEEQSARDRLLFRLADIPVIQSTVKEIENTSAVNQENDECRRSN